LFMIKLERRFSMDGVRVVKARPRIDRCLDGVTRYIPDKQLT
jgi:hypothetical protein